MMTVLGKDCALPSQQDSGFGSNGRGARAGEGLEATQQPEQPGVPERLHKYGLASGQRALLRDGGLECKCWLEAAGPPMPTDLLL